MICFLLIKFLIKFSSNTRVKIRISDYLLERPETLLLVVVLLGLELSVWTVLNHTRKGKKKQKRTKLVEGGTLTLLACSTQLKLVFHETRSY